MNLKKSLQAVNKELKDLVKKVDEVLVAVNKLEKAKIVKKPKPKAKVVKRKPARKTVAKKVAVKKRAVKKPAKKKTTKTAIDTILAMIRRSKKGVSTATLMKKTGFSVRQIHNNVYKLKKQGKVKSVGKGVYLKA